MGIFGKKQEVDESVKNFKPTKIIGGLLMINEERKTWMPLDAAIGKNGARVYNYDDILDYELLEDDEVITKGGVGGAVAGGLLLGGVGAVIGGLAGRKTKSVVNSIKIKITLKDMSFPVVFITLLTGPMESSSTFYQKASKNAQEILSALSIISNENKDDD